MTVEHPRAHALPEAVVWHEVECGSYRADLGLWLGLAAQLGDPILEIGAGTGRVALELARAGHRVCALDSDPVLLAELSRRARGVAVRTVLADARDFALHERFALIVVPMQTVQLLGGPSGRARFLEGAAAQLRPGGVLALAITERFELYEADDEDSSPLPDIREHEGAIYCSHPIAVREDGAGYVVERRRERTGANGRYTSHLDLVRLDAVSARGLEAEGAALGLKPVGRRRVEPTAEHVGSVVVLLGA